jgi:phage shock protein A
VAALQAVVAAGVEDGTISEKAAEEIQKKVDAALEKFADGDTEGAIKELEDLEKKVDEMVEKDEVANSQEQRLDRAIEDLAEAMFFAAPPDDDDED